jgi:hypothetical protein
MFLKHMPQEGKERVLKQLNITVAFFLNIRLRCKSPTAASTKAYCGIKCIIVKGCFIVSVE